MAQADYSIANQGFPATRAEINSTLEAIATNNSGTSAPSTQYAGQFWIDTTSSTWTMYIHDGTDDIQFATIDTSANTVNFIDSELASDVVINTSGDITTTGAFTSVGIDDNATSTAITIDSSENVGIGTSSPDDVLAVNGGGVFITHNTPRVTFETTGAVKTNWRLTAQDTVDNAFEIQKGSADADASDDTFSPLMVIDSSGNVGIGTSSPTAKTEINSGTLNVALGLTSTDTSSYLSLRDSTTSSAHSNATVAVGAQGDDMLFRAGSNERMRIDSFGRVAIGKAPDDSFGVAGCEFNPNGYLLFNRNGQMAYFNRPTTDGALVDFRHAGTAEGSISVSGATVSYNGFTGTHWSRFIDNSTPNILRGTVLESLDEMCDWYNLEFDVTTQDDDGNDVTTTKKIPHVLVEGQSNGDVITYDWNTEKKDENDNDIIEQVQATIIKETDIKHVKSKVSNTVDAKNVYGVFSAYDEDGEGYNDFYVASVGSFVVRIKQGETIAKGDLLQSNGDGTAKVQTDDNIKSSSFAKVLSTTVIETYDDGSYLVPCSLMC